MFGANPKLAIKNSDGSFLDIVEIFYTFQGEGVFTGYPAVFVRLGGCNLACKFCDTEFDDYQSISIEQIILEIKNKIKPFFQKNHLIVITGGEPMRQNITPLCKLLINNNFIVQIETNGTIFQNLPEEVKIICSPKITNGKYHPIRPDLLKKINAFKFLTASNSDYEKIPNLGQNEYNIPVYLQPIDEKNAEKNDKNRVLTLELAKKHNCRISLQTHKIWQIE